MESSETGKVEKNIKKSPLETCRFQRALLLREADTACIIKQHFTQISYLCRLNINHHKLHFHFNSRHFTMKEVIEDLLIEINHVDF